MRSKIRIYIIILPVILCSLLCIFMNHCFRLFAINSSKDSNGIVSFLSYNIHSTGSSFETNALRIAKLVCHENPDFVYLTEFYENKGDTIDTVLKNRFPYSCTKHRWGQNEGDAFYSKWKIDSVARFYVEGNRIMAYRVQISNAGDSIAMYCCHLASNNADSHTTTWESVQEGYAKRKKEVVEILKYVRGDKYPCIILGDMNDVSGSPAMNAIEDAGFEDAWWNGGFGYGSTFHEGWLRLRIDHIFYDKSFDLCDIRVVHSDYSDHDALVGSFNLKR